MRTADFHFDLPPELIAQRPAPQRDQSRLLVMHRETGQIEHRRFRDLLEFLRAGDVLVLNNSRVIPARLRGVNAHTGGAFEMLLLEENATNDWWAMLKPGKRARAGTQIQITSRSSRGNKAQSSKTSEPSHLGCYDIKAGVIETNDAGHRRLRFDGVRNILDVLDELGEVPLPPYIHRDLGTPNFRSARPDKRLRRADQEIGAPSANATHDLDRERYQTVFAQVAGSVAAPTAGLHFTEGLLEDIRARGVETHFVTLHVGPGTFAPVKAETLAAHAMYEERFEVSEATAQAVNKAKTTGRRVIAVGTTSVRVLESVAWQDGGRLIAGRRHTKIFIHPPSDFRIVDALLTNFHLPCSTLLMLVSAFAAPHETRGREMILAAYGAAIRERYRFFSYGDAMLIL
jgi:S-adenosylmethionine:tRNA ribosyltransferase-isomerase